ncbi:hypothetical protein I6N91_01750 [Arthrobacter sp. MSA 4-2]|uniref:hypothetical protein n=1 Tax=Arthrobacter sp. MSA 4-2 TaxID=2794349 RepID=UPI0018E7EF1D|nr:hypothetical protein [Arthrobacter sp. MSA 4-2]MBJ2119701.1 hypothetical protein [Arthrobacter sp. MSA 4-2]
MASLQKPSGRFRPLRVLLPVAGVALCAFLIISPPGGSLDAARTAPGGTESEAPGTGPEATRGAGEKASEEAAPVKTAPAGSKPATKAPAAPEAETGGGAPGAVPAPAASARVPVPAAEKEKASTVSRAYVGKTASVLAAAETPTADELKALAVGPAQGAILAQAAEFESNNWRQEGVPTIAGLEIVAYDGAATPARMTVNACIDSSKVRVVTDEGVVLREGSARSRSLNVLSLVRGDGGTWLVEEISFPDDPSC